MKVANELKQNTIFLSFCSDANDILKLRGYFDYEINVIAKIENELGINNLDQICSKANGILIDRGDLSREVPIEKIPFVQSYIIEKSKENSTPVYVATNLMENMISNSKPTRAEVNAIVSSLKTGADGLVLAAETAIGKYPVECVRIMSRIIDEVDNENKYLELKNNSHEFVNYLLDPPANKIIEPHGGKLIQNFEENFDSKKLNELSELSVNEMIKSDIIQICNGTYSPIEKFMNLEETFSVLNNNRLLNNEVWTLPIIFQISKEEKKNLSENELITIKDKKSNKVFALMNITSIEKINNLDEMASKWYGTTNAKHPGVSKFLQNGDYIICGKPFMLKGQKYISSYSPFDLTTKQTREIINHNGWYNVIGFHTRNILHKGHEFIQKYAIEESNADAIFISPVSGIKKPQDYKTEVIIECYEKAIKENLFNYCPVLIGTFNTYSRYAGPREAVFTALCRKNFGCNYFIIGRDHTGLGKFYGGKESQNIFNDIPDVGINIIKVDEVVYSKVKKKHVFKNKLNNNNDSFESISASLIREMLKSGKPIPDWLMNNKISEFLVKKIKNNESILIS